MTDPSENGPSEAEQPQPGTGKKRKKRRAPAATFLRPPLNAKGQERPQFLLNYPEDPELERRIGAFENGNYDVIRRDAPLLAERTEDPAVREAALELRDRINPDPLLKYMLAIGAGLLTFLTIYTYASR